ncbi:HlyD family type I secretion periplasmic adaptor subunit [Paraburkholderia sp. J12]|uniref:HlyD family type I secretion periplasmic adaptor subunit n=1 Tax=Paraburkholderia sp. J12 TaxID=2805432 RepID=UPI002ABD9C49|nr:HlyD family type I secretion periplasmic adaptor subunit [Paraburkholderia sp. J12]
MMTRLCERFNAATAKAVRWLGSSADAAVDDRLPLPRRLILGGTLGLAVWIVAIFAWAALAPLSGAVVAEGVVQSDGERKTVQHQEGGIVKAILVKDGDAVRAGQTLLVLDNLRPAAAVDALQIQLDAEDVKIARLMAERDLKDAPEFPERLTSRRDDPRVAELLQRELTLFTARRRALLDQVSMLQTELGQTRQEIALSQQMVGTADRAHTLAEQQLQTNEELQKEGFVAQTKVVDLRRSEADSLSRVQSASAELMRAKQKQTDIELKITSLKNDYSKAASDELKEATSKAFQLTDQIRPAKDVSARTQITAPVAGVVVGLNVHTVGAVIGPRDPILDIVPKNTALVIEAKIKPDDIREIALQSVADVRLTAYNSRVTPTLKGRVVYISADALTDKDTRKPYYTSRIEVSADALRQANRISRQTVALGPGLRAEIFIQTYARSALDYLLEPIKDGIRRSMRD